jgi:hypothetical protein
MELVCNLVDSEVSEEPAVPILRLNFFLEDERSRFQRSAHLHMLKVSIFTLIKLFFNAVSTIKFIYVYIRNKCEDDHA